MRWLALAPLCLFFPAFLASKPGSYEVSKRHPQRTEGGIHLPIHRRELPRVQRRDGLTSSIGLGDYVDVRYNVLVTVGNITTPLLLDTGSSDLWVISDTCIDNCATNLPLYPQATFQSTDLVVNLLYGDSTHSTHAYGPIGTDAVGIAGLSLPNQYFAAINDTNMEVLETGSTGIFGLSFPVISVIWSGVFNEHYSGGLKRHEDDDAFPQLHSRQQSQASSLPLLSSWAPYGPFLGRLIMSASLAAPMFTISLQRDTIDIGGNIGMLSIGELPEGATNDSLTWVDVRTYPSTQGGLVDLVGPPDSPNELYPQTWEIFIDDVFLDGTVLPRSTLVASNIGVSALLDTGDSLVRGPSDVITNIVSRIGGSRFSCSTPHTLAFQIGGKLFPIDPRDFINQPINNNVSGCGPNLAVTDTPVVGNGFLYSWTLGDPFLKSVQASFYFGNLTHPSRDPPRIGLLSTVPPDAGDQLEAAVSLAGQTGGNFPATTETAPAYSLPPTTTSSNQNNAPAASPTLAEASTPNGAPRLMVRLMNMIFAGLVVGLAWV